MLRAGYPPDEDVALWEILMDLNGSIAGRAMLFFSEILLQIESTCESSCGSNFSWWRA